MERPVVEEEEDLNPIIDEENIDIGEDDGSDESTETGSDDVEEKEDTAEESVPDIEDD